MVERSVASVEEGISLGEGEKPEAGNAENDMILGKFKTHEDLEKAYKELESKLGRQARPEPEDDWKPEPVPEQPEQQATEEQIKGMLPGFDDNTIEEMSNYAWENGSLSDEHYEALERSGYSREIVDQFMQGQFAAANAAQMQIINAGGGEERVNQMFAWAENNLDQATIDSYNERFARGGSDAIMAMENLKAKFDSDGNASLVRGANVPANDGPAAFRSVDQVRQAMSDPRYETDPAYRQEVAERLARSNVL